MAVFLSPVGGVAAQFFDNNGVILTGGKIYTYTAGTTTPQATYTSSSGSTAHSNPIILDASGRVPSGEIWLTDLLSYKFVVKDANEVLIGTYDNIVGINSNFLSFTNQQEIQTATANQTVFTLTTAQYQPGTNSLSVFVDGVNQYGPGAQYAYVENNENTVTFSNGLHNGALVKFTTSQLNSSISVSAAEVSYTPPFTNSVSTNVENKLAQTISVTDFGVAGDGITDDTATIQAAVDAVSAAGGGILFFPEGTYLLKGKNSPINNNSRLVDGVTLKSNVTFQGVGNASIIKVDVNCANGFTGRFRAAATVQTNLTNIQFRNLQFTRAPTTFFEQQYQLWFDTGTNIVVDSCTFTGWSGDAIIIGNILNADTSAWLQSICDNIQITNCTFDGVDKNNRNAISVFSGTNIEIAGNFFRNTTRVGMPGAIDLEPELVTNLIENISIHDNTFSNIGGSVGVIGCSLFANLTNGAKNIYIYDNLIADCDNIYAFWCLGIETVTTDLAPNAPQNIIIQNNDVRQTPSRMFAILGIADCSLIGNSFQGQTSTALLALCNTPSRFLSLRNFKFLNNTFVDCHVISTDTYTPLIGVYGKVGGGSFGGNVFISSGRWSNVSTPASIEVLGFMNPTAAMSTYLTIVNNTVTTNGLAYSTVIPPFFTSAGFDNPTTLACVNNKFLGYAETGDVYSVQTYVDTAITNGSVSYKNLTAAPSSPKVGDVYYNSTTNKLACWNGTIWNDLF